MSEVAKTWFDEIKEQFAELEKNVALFYEKGKKGASSDARKNLQNLRLLAKTGREHIQATRSSMTTKKA
jgi:hypothetical protein